MSVEPYDWQRDDGLDFPDDPRDEPTLEEVIIVLGVCCESSRCSVADGGRRNTVMDAGSHQGSDRVVRAAPGAARRE